MDIFLNSDIDTSFDITITVTLLRKDMISRVDTKYASMYWCNNDLLRSLDHIIGKFFNDYHSKPFDEFGFKEKIDLKLLLKNKIASSKFKKSGEIKICILTPMLTKDGVEDNTVLKSGFNFMQVLRTI